MSLQDVRILTAALTAPADALEELQAFYGQRLGLPCRAAEDRIGVTVGAATLTFVAVADGSRPFHHFALLVDAGRFAAARAWLESRAELLPDPQTGETVFAFPEWDATACYFHDPAGNIGEIIAHGPTHGRSEDGGFSGAELLGVSEVGLVAPDPAAAAEALSGELGLGIWSGAVPSGGDGLAFIGRKAHTLILSGVGRGWLPLGRPAEPHGADVTIGGAPARSVRLPGAPLVVRRRP